MPFLLLTLVLALITPALIGGWLFSTKALGFKANKLNPLTGLKRMLGTQALMELVKALVKFILVAGIGYLVVVSQIDHLLALGQMPLELAMQEGGTIASLDATIASHSLVRKWPRCTTRLQWK